MGKLVKHESSIDRLSALPDSVLSHILSFLPTKYAVRTSILSTRWRYLSTSVTTLDFDNYPAPSDNFMNFVDRVLFFHDATSIERFRLRLRCGELKIVDYIYRICGWISFALRRRVQELDLDMFVGDELDMFIIGDPSGILPPSLFTNKTLVKLVLHFPYDEFVMTVPTKVCLPSLKTLRLEYVNFVDDDSIRRLFSGCLVLEELFILYEMWLNLSEINISNPSLKRLTISCCDDEYDHHLNFVIDAPSLVDFEFSEIIAESYLLVNLHSLVKAHMDYLFCRGNFNIASNLLKGISNVQSLCVTPDFLKLFTFCDKPIPVFRNLVCMEIYNGPWHNRHFGEENELKKFLESSPNLETLIFVGGAFESLTLYPSKTVPSCLFSHLKVIEIYSFGGKMKLVKYFLKNASVLAKLKIQMDLQAKKQFKIAKKLLMLSRESKICQVEIV